MSEERRPSRAEAVAKRLGFHPVVCSVREGGRRWQREGNPDQYTDRELIEKFA